MLDLTRVIAGPVAIRTLAAHGADVLRLDAPDRPEIPLRSAARPLQHGGSTPTGWEQSHHAVIPEADPGPLLVDLATADGLLALTAPPGTVDGRSLGWPDPAPAVGAAEPRWT